MIRGPFSGSIGAALAITGSAELPLVLVLPFGALAWIVVFVAAGLPLFLASMIVLPLQRLPRNRIQGPLRFPVAVLAAVPFGLLIGAALFKLLGGKGGLLASEGFDGPMRTGLAGGLGLGLGCVQDAFHQD